MHADRLVVANWKMNGRLSQCEWPLELITHLPNGIPNDMEVVICPPATLLSVMAQSASLANVQLGGQTCHAADSGAHTGEISASILVDAGASYVIIGHSERRASGQTPKDVAKCHAAAISQGLRPIICVGERESQRDAGQAEEVVMQMLVDLGGWDNVDIAYEPVWAIGTGKTPSARDISDMHALIRGQVGKNPRILYGGSVKPDNAAEILGLQDVDGALVGGASLQADSFAEIIKAAG